MADAYHKQYHGEDSIVVRQAKVAAASLLEEHPHLITTRGQVGQSHIDQVSQQIGGRLNQQQVTEIICKVVAAKRETTRQDSPKAAFYEVMNSGKGRSLEERADFVNHVKRFDRSVVDARMQRHRNTQRYRDGLPALPTPDILFRESTLVCGHKIKWLAFKYQFGFVSSDLATRDNEQRFQKCVNEYGPGIVAWNNGYQQGYPEIDGVESFDASEVLTFFDQA